MKVLYLVPQPKRPDRIGAYTFLDEEIQALARAGVEAYVLSSAAPSDGWCGAVRMISADARSKPADRLRSVPFLAKALGSASTSHMRHPVVGYRSAWREYLAARVAVEQRIDLIHSHFAWPAGSGGLLARAATGRPLVASLRGTDILLDATINHGRRRMPTFDRAVRRLLKEADCTHYFSDYMRNKALTLGARPQAARVIRKGVDGQLFGAVADRGTLKGALGLGSAPVVLAVGGLTSLKSVHHVLEALARLLGRHDFTFVVCGEGPERHRLEQLSRQLKLEGRTMFMGRVERAMIPQYFAACDVFVLASAIEAAGNVVLEAMASARPVVCTQSGGPQEYVTDGETGFVVPVGDIERLASRIGQLLGDPGLQDRLGQEGRRRTLTEFSYERMVAAFLELYEDVLRTGPAAAPFMEGLGVVC